ncbi:Retrovirus-related Pol polyprotein from type-1 retrotransposable element R2 [Stylophora pistillata]|uniref:Retrovirus-related Pol polyprotein from type-1 retrotransposable element R2 n=1 Tax=Stylophora pistillata TaxID=50429 RepID=A0A2B4SJW1_STYPI|nr:Retrovirus-related Pol polyprotein from type-1 retrotransposable element R2 [Stylophora pistillata]
MAWVDVRKAYDSVDHNWLIEMMEVHRVPAWIGKVIKHLSASWITKIVATTKQGSEKSTTIRFHKGLPQGDALCPRLFKLCLNPVAWILNATEGYRLSKPLSTRITNLLYVDDMKVFAASETKLNQVLRSTCTAMQDMGLHWNSKKCSVIHVRRGKQVEDAKDVKLNETSVVKNLESGSNYKFLGIKESVMQDEKQALTEAAKHWPLAELRDIDRQTRKTICENGGCQPLSSIAVLYLPREKGGRGLRAIEQEYKLIKIKAAVKLYESLDPKMKSVQQFEECAIVKGFSSLITDSKKSAQELDTTLNLNTTEPSCSPTDEPEIATKDLHIKKHINKVVNEKLVKKFEDQQWQGSLLKARWQDDQLSLENCFAWLNKWQCSPTHCIAGIMELYEQLTPTKVYMAYKNGQERCQM